MSTAYERGADGQKTGRFVSSIYSNAAAVDISILPGLNIDFNAIWGEL
jgi:hypothetical protein